MKRRVRWPKRSPQAPRGVGPNDGKSNALLRQALDARQRGDEMAARDGFEKAVEANPRNWAALLIRALSLAKAAADDPELAIQILADARADMTAPTRAPDPIPYFDDPNYWRLSYQLTALRLNAFVATEQGELSLVDLQAELAELEAEIDGNEISSGLASYLDGLRRIVAVRREASAVVASGATELIEEGGREIRRLQSEMDGGDEARGSEHLNQRRLRRFLRRTVIPCAEIVMAATELHAGEVEASEARIEEIRRRARSEPFGYRVHYNLACYEAERAGPEPEDGNRDKAREGRATDALADLRAALRMSHGVARMELVARARSDPALGYLQSERTDRERKNRFRRLLDLFDPRLAEGTTTRAPRG
jgi:hypothetical protein